jgi:hypothetical protein
MAAKYKKHLTAAGERVVSLYDAWGKKDKAEEWRKRLAPTAAEPARPKPCGGDIVC